MKLGINEEISNEDYHADRKYVSSSGLKTILNNPRKYYQEYVLNERGANRNQSAMDFGSYLHCVILEPHLVDAEFAVFSGVMRRGAVWEKFKEENKNKIIITRVQKTQCDALISSFAEATVVIGKQGIDKEVSVPSFFNHGYPEQTMCGEINGVQIKVRTDYRKEFEDFGSINDLKTTSEYIGDVKSVQKVCASWDYDLSAALYVDIATQVTGKPHDFYFTFLSKKNQECKIYKASEQMLKTGREKYTKAIEMLKQAQESGIYYINKIQEIDSVER